jgi:alanine racemase
LRIANNIQRAPLRVWLKLDSGMHRLGLTPDEFAGADRILRSAPGVAELLHLTHLSSAEDLTSPATRQQIRVFDAAHNALSDSAASAANSAALITQAVTHCEWVRPGIMLYGENPVAAMRALPLRPVMTLTANVIALRQLASGEAVGYNGTWTSARPSMIATIGIGYGDGYPRHAKNGTPVWINGQVALLAGRVSMDLITVDVTDCNHVAIGDEVQLWGPQLSASVVAEFADTISYELFTSIGSRVPRIYSDG